MKSKLFHFYFLYFIFFSSCQLSFAESCDVDEENNLFNDLLTVQYWNSKLNDRFPVMYDHFLQGGYFIMPAARMSQEGEIGIGYSHVPPYLNWNLRLQFTDRLEISGSYRIFKGIEDPILTPLGFGDLSDKGANFKIQIFHPEDSDYYLPGFAIGMQDFMGTRSFKAQYAVFTQIFKKYNLELSLGYGGGRIQGLFGGFAWYPFRLSSKSYLQNLVFTGEYDATPYWDPEIEKHPKGRKSSSPINIGVKYRLLDHFDFSISSLRGRSMAVSFGAFYNLGLTKGFVPKINDPLPYVAPKIWEELGPNRTELAMSEDIYYAFRTQGFDIYQIWVFYDECGEKTLRIHMYNTYYRDESEVRERLNYLLGGVIPENIDKVIVTIESEGFPIQEYRYYMNFVRQWVNESTCDYELKVLTPMQEVSFPNECIEKLIFEKKPERFNFEILPKTRSLFGSSKGKFKYCLGLNFGINGYIGDQIFYSLLLGWNAFSDMGKIAAVDRLNPSKLINVRTDIIRYYTKRGITFDELYLQKNWNLGKGFYSKIALGHFEPEYGGCALEALFYPVNSNFALGVEGAIVKKRTVGGLGFTGKIRKFVDWQVTHRPFLGSQFFVDMYYFWEKANINFKIKAGKFLANDWGSRFEIARFFPSGLCVSIWYTYTNGHDRINGQTYYDKGVAFSMPLDIFYTHSDRTRWGYGMSAWLRDVGAFAMTGKDLYDMIFEYRF